MTPEKFRSSVFILLRIYFLKISHKTHIRQDNTGNVLRLIKP